MRMIQTFYKTLPAVTIMAFTWVCLPAHAQYEYEQGLPWPKTFVGEPDFDFMRDEVIEEFKKKKGNESTKYISTLNDLLNAKEIDPYIPRPRTTDIGRSKYSQDVFEKRFLETPKTFKKFRDVYPDVEIGTGLDVVLASGATVQAKLINDNEAQTLEEENPTTIQIAVNENDVVVENVQTESISDTFQDLFSKKAETTKENTNEKLEGVPSYSLAVSKLPELEGVSTDMKDSLTEFALFLDNIIKQAQKNQEADLKDTDFRQYLTGIKLQSVATSPVKYVIINGVRFEEGDRIPIRVAYKRKTTEDLDKIIATYMPSKEGLPEGMYEKYISLKNTALEQFKQKQAEEIALNEVDNSGEKQIISATIKKIESRKVILSILNKDYPIKMRFAL